MARENWDEDAEVLCPFYRKEAKNKIACEGVQEGNTIHNAFEIKSDKEEYRSTFCRGDWRWCPIAMMHLHKTI